MENLCPEGILGRKRTKMGFMENWCFEGTRWGKNGAFRHN